MVVTKKVITIEDLNRMIVLKRDKVWTDGKIVYKKDTTGRASRLKDYYEYFSLFPELSDCEFPNDILYIEIAKNDYREFGYTENYFNDYICMGKRPGKKVLPLADKKIIIYKLIELMKKIHENEFVHNDLHISNLLRKDQNIKLIDFDLMIPKEIVVPSMYTNALISEMYYLNLLILAILFDKPMACIQQEEYKNFIDELDISLEYKKYLYNTLEFNESIIGNYPEEYIKHIRKGTIEKGKKLTNMLQI